MNMTLTAYGFPLIVNVVNHPVIAYPYTPTALGSGYLPASGWPRIGGKFFNMGNDSVENFRRKAA